MRYRLNLDFLRCIPIRFLILQKFQLMIRKLLLVLSILTAVFVTSCRDDFNFEPSTGGLEFSKNTVYLDTVFTNIGSSTYRLKVYNRSDNDIKIPKIQLEKGVNSKFRIMVDGMTGDAGATGKIFSNVEMKAKDSMFIFIEVTANIADANPTDFLYTDKILFNHGNGSQQNVDLVTLIQDAIFIYPERTQSGNTYLYETATLGLDTNNTPIISGYTHTLVNSHPVNGDELHWTNTKPYVVYGFAFVPDGKELFIDSGARIYFHADAGLMIGRDGKLTVNGQNPTVAPLETDLANEVVFEGDRLEYSFDNVPGQWFGILNFSTRTDNVINHLTIKNATIGIYSDLIQTDDIPKYTITNSKIQNCSYAGMLSRKSTITGNNVVVNNCGTACFVAQLGGNYTFSHCTFNNNWYSNQHTAVYLSDYYETSDAHIYTDDAKNFTFTDCIIYGSNQNELQISKSSSSTTALNFNFNTCLIKSNVTNGNPFYPPTNTTNYINCSISNYNNIVNPKFKSVANHQLWPTVVIMLASNTTNDIFGVPNTYVGAYNVIP